MVSISSFSFHFSFLFSSTNSMFEKSSLLLLRKASRTFYAGSLSCVQIIPLVALFDIGISFFFYRYCCCRILAFKNRPYICWLNLTIGVDTIQFCLAIIDVLCLDSICIDLDIFCSSFQSFIFTGINEFNPVK